MVPSLEVFGWCEMDGTWKPVWMTLPEAAKLPVSSSLNVAANKDVLEDVNVEKLISLVQRYVSVQENAPIINTDLNLKE